MVEHTSNARTVRIVRALIQRIVHQKALFATRKIAIDKNVVPAVVDATIPTPGRPDIREFVELGPIRNVNSRVTRRYPTIRTFNGLVGRIPGICAGYATAGEIGDPHRIDNALIRLLGARFGFRIVALPQDSVTRSDS